MADLSLKSMRSHPMFRKDRRRKVKTGCRTCKIRKVKCDEGWPACRVCISTGRVCDGYGIFGGGGNRYEQRKSGQVTATPMNTTRSSESAKLLLRSNLSPSITPLSSTEEHLHFEFFKDETLAKLPGVYSSKYNNLWEALVLQACAEEPAVMHAVLAISSAHRRKVLDGVSRNKVLLHPDKQEEFLLRNYCKSIEHLQPRFRSCSERFLRTALITCLVFIYLELLRGNYKRACVHLEGGMNLLSSLILETNRKKLSSNISLANPSLSSGQNGVDGFLMEAFARLRVQITFCDQRCGTDSTIVPYLLSDLPTLKFSSPHEARHYLDRVFEGVGRLSQAMRDGTYASWPADYWEIVHTEQHLMQGSLDSWLRSYSATIADDVSIGMDDKLNRYGILHVYHTMAEVMAGTCLSPDQSVFDQYSSQFRSVVTQSKIIALNSDPSRTRAYGDASQLSSCRRMWPDVSWMPPLYYTALKCRFHDIRIQAVELMSSFWRYETDWDLEILNKARLVAKEVIRMEEGNFFKENDQNSTKGNTWSNSVEHRPRRMPLPEERRFDTVEMVLPDDAPGNVQILCKKRNKGQVQTIREVYEELHGTWTKLEEAPPMAS